MAEPTREVVIDPTADPYDNIAILEGARKSAPRNYEVLTLLGRFYRETLQNEAAIETYRHAIELRPNEPTAYLNGGNACIDLGDNKAAIAFYRNGLKANPSDSKLIHALGEAHLRMENFVEGWPGYEAREAIMGLAEIKAQMGLPEWTGEPLQGKTLLLYYEQGFGDTLQMLRFLPLIHAREPRQVYLMVQEPLRALVERNHPQITLMPFSPHAPSL